MLSRVAERLYWLARYMERIENTARLVKVHSQLMLDLPKSVKLDWYTLVQITSSEDYFDQHYGVKSETSCINMLLTDLEHPASLISALWWARENIRTTRDSLPKEAWIQVNELYLMVKNRQEDFLVRSTRNQLLNQIIRACQAWFGMLAGSMSHNEAYRFIQLGISIERADMTSRLLDEGGLFIGQAVESDEAQAYSGIVWANLLKSSSADFMYRQSVQSEMDGQGVVEFLMQDPKFVRSIQFSISQLEQLIKDLPRAKAVTKQLQTLRQDIDSGMELKVGTMALHDSLDRFQAKLSEVHNLFYTLWFSPTRVAA